VSLPLEAGQILSDGISLSRGHDIDHHRSDAVGRDWRFITVPIPTRQADQIPGGPTGQVLIIDAWSLPS
jgi:hypothetical protein